MFANSVALCAAIALTPEEPTAPAWVHVLPAGEIKSQDGRGPYYVTDPMQLAAASIAEAGGRMVLCDNHATDLAAPRGEPAPARGWITDLQARPDGIWGRVEWTSEGRRLVEAREYRGISPVIAHRDDGEITSILRASLVNQPNFIGLTALHMAQPRSKMDDVDRLIRDQMGISTEKYLRLLEHSLDFKRQIEPLRIFYQKNGLPKGRSF